MQSAYQLAYYWIHKTWRFLEVPREVIRLPETGRSLKTNVGLLIELRNIRGTSFNPLRCTSEPRPGPPASTKTPPSSPHRRPTLSRLSRMVSAARDIEACRAPAAWSTRCKHCVASRSVSLKASRSTARSRARPRAKHVARVSFWSLSCLLWRRGRLWGPPNCNALVRSLVEKISTRIEHRNVVAWLRGWKPDAPENKKTRRPHFGVSALRDRPSTAPASTVAAAFSTFSKASLARAWMERWQCRELLSCPVLPGSCPSLHRLSKQNRPRLQLLGRLIWMDLQCQLLVAGPRAFAINGVLVGPTTSVEVGVGNRELGKWGGWLGHGWA